MEIEVRWLDNEYADISVSVDNDRLDVGMLDERGRRELADKLMDTIEELVKD